MVCGGVDLDWLPGAHQATLSLPLLSRTGEKNRAGMKSSQAEIRTGRSLANYHHRQNSLNLGKINLMCRQLNKVK